MLELESTPDDQIEPSPAAVDEVRRRRSLGVWVSALWIGVLVTAAAFAPVLPLPDPNSSDYHAIRRPPGTSSHLLGTDQLGRDLLSRLVFGARISLLVSCAAVLLAALVGGGLGLAAGYLRGWFDRLVMLGTDAVMAFPSIVVIIVLVALLGPSIGSLTLGLLTVFLPAFLRLTRGAAIGLAPRDYVTAARASGASSFRILRRELLPTVTWMILTYTVIGAANAVVAEGSLSFIGLGMRPPASTWGTIIASGLDKLERSPYISLLPALTLCLTVLTLNRLGEWLRARSNVGSGRR